MSQVTENGILEQAAFDAFKARSWELKFKQALFQGVGGATIFGVVATTMTAILGAASGGTAIFAALGGFAGIAAISVLMVGAMVCIGIGSRYTFESQILDQDFQAKKIAAATALGHGHAIAMTHEPRPTHTNPPGMNAHEQHTSEQAHAGKWAETVGQRAHAESHAAAHEKKPHDPSVPKPHVDSWAEQVHADQHADTTRTIH